MGSFALMLTPYYQAVRIDDSRIMTKLYHTAREGLESARWNCWQRAIMMLG